MVSNFLSKYNQKSFEATIFLGASENDNVVFYPGRDGWKDLIGKKQVHIIGASWDENFLRLLLGKIPKYSMLTKIRATDN